MSQTSSERIVVDAKEAIARIRADKQKWNEWVAQNTNAFVNFQQYKFHGIERDLFEGVHFPEVSFQMPNSIVKSVLETLYDLFHLVNFWPNLSK